MNDCELLWWAAKAAGFPLSSEWDCAAEGRGIIIGRGNGDLRSWNPLDDDGEAFRLSVMLQISVMSNIVRYEVSTIALTLAGIFIKECMLSKSADVAARRAIVRAAAELGRLAQ